MDSCTTTETQENPVQEEELEPIWEDLLFRQKRKKNTYRPVLAPEPALEAPIADTHAHLGMLARPDISLARASWYNVGFICAMCDPAEDHLITFEGLDGWLEQAESIKHALMENSLAEAAALGNAELTAQLQGLEEHPLPQVRIALGCHPHNAAKYTSAMEEEIRRRAQDPRVCAIGEIGLDYHYDFSPRATQIEVFKQQIRLAKELELPILLHLRSAHDDAYRVLVDEGLPEAGVLLHCFTLGFDKAERWIELGCTLAFGGSVTFKRFDPLRECVAQVPLEQLVFETDAPYMTPEPMRGRSCGPEDTIFTAACAAQARGLKPGAQRNAFLEAVYHNIERFFKLDLTTNAN